MSTAFPFFASPALVLLLRRANPIPIVEQVEPVSCSCTQIENVELGQRRHPSVLMHFVNRSTCARLFEYRQRFDLSRPSSTEDQW